MPKRSTTSAGRDAVESVTTATGPAPGRASADGIGVLDERGRCLLRARSGTCDVGHVGARATRERAAVPGRAPATLQQPGCRHGRVVPRQPPAGALERQLAPVTVAQRAE